MALRKDSSPPPPKRKLLLSQLDDIGTRFEEGIPSFAIPASKLSAVKFTSSDGNSKNLNGEDEGEEGWEGDLPQATISKLVRIRDAVKANSVIDPEEKDGILDIH